MFSFLPVEMAARQYRPLRGAWAVLAMLGVLLSGTARAQAVANYTFAATSGTFTPNSAAATDVPTLLADDVASAALPLSFNFEFSGTTYTQLYASSNGTLSFGAAYSSTGNNLNVSTTSRPLIAPLWDDLDGRPTGATARASYEITGTTPNRVFTFEWQNWEWRYTAGVAVISFQAKLYEGSNLVQFVYRPEGGTPTTPTASVGLAGLVNGDFLSLSDLSAAPTTSSTTSTNSIAAVPVTGQTYTFTPGVPAACPAPVQLTATSVTGTSATLGFTAQGTGGTYNIIYGPTGFDPATTGTTISGLTGTSTAVTGLSASTTYQFYAVHVCGGTAGNSTLTGPLSFTTAILNDDPTGAITVPVTADCTAPTTGTNVGATTTPVNGYTNPSGCAIASSPKDVWYAFTTPATGAASTAVRIIVTGTVAGQVRLFSASSAAGPFTQVACSGGTTNNTQAAPLDAANLTPNTTYYVFVSGYGSGDTTGSFTICVTDPPACGDPSGATIANLTPTSADLTFTPGNGNTSYVVTITPQGGTTTTITPAPTASPVNLTGLTPATQYTVTLQATCAAGNSVTLTGTFSTPALPPANDDCANASALPVNTTCSVTTGTNNGATASASTVPTPSCGGTTGSLPDVWYSLVVPASGDVTVTTSAISGSSFSDAVMEIYSGSCGSLTSVGCNDDTNGLFSEIALTGQTPGATLYVRVRSYGTSPTGEFGICATTTATSPCVAAGPQVSAITDSSAAVNFTISATATYQATLRNLTAGTAAVTISPAPTASPLTLSGLDPGTSYLLTLSTDCGGSTLIDTVAFQTLALPVTNPAASTVTATSASITFTPAAGATSYTITYTPQGGTAITVTANTSPVTLSSLIPGTSYSVSIVSNYPSGATSTPVTLSFRALLAARAAIGNGVLTVYPNPAHQRFTLTLPAIANERSAQLVLLNSLGQQIATRSISLAPNGTQAQLEVSGLASGLYTLRVQAGSQVAAQQVVVE